MLNSEEEIGEESSYSKRPDVNLEINCYPYSQYALICEIMEGNNLEKLSFSFSVSGEHPQKIKVEISDKISLSNMNNGENPVYYRYSVSVRGRKKEKRHVTRGDISIEYIANIIAKEKMLIL